ncbi:MAG: HPF/RaiA family ribosome-associated protein [Gammaproteobacteria bacterium]|nr:HPF/RaiA family ribosome-associated protein [Gammaproteobacteria bacterium]
MQLAPQITFRHMEASSAMEDAIRNRIAELDQFHHHIMSCRVVMEPESRHSQSGNIYRVRIDVTVPGRELVVSRESGMNQSHADAYVAIRDAFDAMRRKLDEDVQRRQGEIKHHDTPPHGKIVELSAREGYGRIATLDGREIYFHRNSLINASFDSLELGAEVRFAEEAGDEGPQATTVSVVGKHHVVG